MAASGFGPLRTALPWQLDRLATLGAQVLGVTGVGVMLLDPAGALRPVVSSDVSGGLLADAQADLGSGPCPDAVATAGSVAVDELGTDPRYGPLAGWLARGGVRTVASVLSVPVLVAGEAVGGLDAYRDRVEPWSAAARRAVAAYAGLVGLVLDASTTRAVRLAGGPR